MKRSIHFCGIFVRFTQGYIFTSFIRHILFLNLLEISFWDPPSGGPGIFRTKRMGLLWILAVINSYGVGKSPMMGSQARAYIYAQTFIAPQPHSNVPLTAQLLHDCSS